MSANLVLLGISLMIWGVGEGMFFIFQPLYLQQLGANPVAIGAIIGAAGVAMTVAHIPAGYLADRIGRKPLLMAAWIFGLLAAWGMALAPSLPWFVAAVLIYSITAFVSSPLSSYITTARGKLGVGRALTIVSALYNTGAILGPLLGGQIAQRFGLRSIYFIAASTFVLSTIVLFFIRAQPLDHSNPEELTNGRFINRRFITYQIVIFLAGFSMYLSQPLTANYLQNQHFLSFDTIGILGSISSVGVVVLNLVLGSLRPFTGYLLSQVSVAIFAFILWHGSGLPLFSLAAFMLGGYRISRSLATAQTRSLIHQSKMGLAYGITETVGSSSVILAAPVAGFLYKLNPTSMYAAAFTLITISILVGFFFIPRPKSPI